MNTNDNHSVDQLMACLVQHEISEKMIAIVERQRISDEDIKSIDRDDVEHLFKNEFGFTFRDRKRFWNVIQNMQLAEISDVKDEHTLDSPEILEHIYDFAEEEIENNDSKEQSLRASPSNINRPLEIINLIDNAKADEDESNNNDDHQSRSSSYISELSFTSDYVFTYPSILPSFSLNITQALQTNSIHKQWAAFINELARWVMSIKPCLREQHEYRAIGQTLYERYPSIGTAGPKPWSFLCRSLSQRIRTERWQRRKTLAATKRRETNRRKIDRTCNHQRAEML